MEPRQALLLKTLVQMAWADHKLVDEERAFLGRALAALGATGAEIDELESRREAVDLQALATTLPGLPERLEAMRLLLRVAFADEALTFEEFDLIDRLANALGLDDAQLEQLRQEALASG